MWTYGTLGIPDEFFIQQDKVPGPTKEEIRVLTISKARLREDSIVADVGCGTGGLTVEAAQITQKGKTYAIDEDPQATQLTQANVFKFSMQSTVQVIEGKAAEVLPNLPPLDAVIVGGSHSLRETLRIAQDKLKVNGRIVVNAILLETAVTALDEMKKLGFKDLEAVEVFVAKGKTASFGTMMWARNPIIIISATKE